MGRALFFLFVAGLFIFLDWYTFHGLYGQFSQSKYARAIKGIYWLASGFVYFSIGYLIFMYQQSPGFQRTEMTNFMFGLVFTMFISKLVYASILLLHDTGRLTYGGFVFLKHQLQDTTKTDVGFIPSRREFLTTFGAVMAGIPFFSLLYGITKGKYQYTVEKIVLTFADLPEKFNGFRVVQISDVHAGSFDNKEKVKRGIDLINSLEADVVCFTGDLVNSEKDEIDPYIDIFAQIQARYGKYATLGNHDYYGSYNRENQESEQKYFKDFYGKFKAMGFTLLNNAHEKISLFGQHINIVGVENWGAGRWFPKKGDLDKAIEGIRPGEFNILLSHDPTHFDEKVKHHQTPVQLTLSGHTHGFQFGFQMPGFAWSPAQYRYKKWLGLYEEENKKLYVNRGFGFLGFPGRVGMWPEITLIELQSEGIEKELS